MVTINSNYAASFAANAAKQTQNDLNSSVEKLSTGKRINFAKDDAAGIAIAMRLEAEIGALATASRNAADGQGLIDTADGALKESHALLVRMRELAVQAQNGTLQGSDKAALGLEFDALQKEITRIADTTTWAGINILNGNHSTGVSFRVGTSQNITHSIADMSSTAIGITTSVSHADTITKLDAAISTVSSERANLGGVSNRLDATVANLDQIRVNLTASRGRVEDADFATETGNLAKSQILQQAATAMVAQANASQSAVLTLIQN